MKTVKEFIALAKARPGEINYGTRVTITGPLLAAELFKRQAKVNIVRINYRGTGPAAVALASGEVQVMFAGAGTAMPHIRAGRIRGLAVTTPEPSPLVPGLPSVSASGLPTLPGRYRCGVARPEGYAAIHYNRKGAAATSYCHCGSWTRLQMSHRSPTRRNLSLYRIARTQTRRS